MAAGRRWTATVLAAALSGSTAVELLNAWESPGTTYYSNAELPGDPSDCCGSQLIGDPAYGEDSQICECDLTAGVCDAACCCDQDCSVFESMTVRHALPPRTALPFALLKQRRPRPVPAGLRVLVERDVLGARRGEDVLGGPRADQPTAERRRRRLGDRDGPGRHPVRRARQLGVSWRFLHGPDRGQVRSPLG